MRDYSIVSAKFWIGETGKRLRGNRDAQLLALYLITSPHASMSGLYYCPVAYMAQDLGMTPDEIVGRLTELRDLGFCVYDEDTETVFVIEMARYQVADRLELRDNRRTALVRDLERARTPLVRLFVDRYGEAFQLDAAIFPVVSGWRPGIGVLRALTERDGRACRRCSSTDNLAVDHVLARINGGTNELDNLQFLCKSCNSRKSSEDRRIFWENMNSGVFSSSPSQGAYVSPSEGVRLPLQKGIANPLKSPEQEQEQEPEPEEGPGPSRRSPPAGSPLALFPEPGPVEDGPTEPSEAPTFSSGSFSDRQREALAALGEIPFRVVRWKREEGTVAEILGRVKAHDLARDLGGDGFPAVPVRQTLAQAANWTRSNPAKAKTPGGLRRFLTDWFAREQNRGGPRVHPSAAPMQPPAPRRGGDLLAKVDAIRKGEP